MSERLSPQKINFAKSTNYKLVINAIPGTTFWLTTANIPTISANEVPIPNPIHGHTYQPTTTTIYAPLMCTFLVDEDFSNYMELLNWINMTNHPDTSKRVDSKVDIRTTGSLHILSNNKNTSAYDFSGLLSIFYEDLTN